MKNKPRVPEHIAIIMDGNGRWAKKRRLPRLAGHRQGAENVTNIVKAAHDAGVRYLTLYTFSTENWRRPKTEVNSLMDLFEQVLSKKLPELMENNVKLNIIGDMSAVRKSTSKKFDDALSKTAKNTGLILTIALNYSGRNEIVRAIKRLMADGLKEVDEDAIRRYLDTSTMPDPELLIRTSGEVRVSNFLLWQIAYSEIYFTDVLWPDFEREHLYEAIGDFQRRERRFGGL
jgi:undecaprenyl diphosphate synthase